MKTSEYLGKARDVLARGWCQHDYANGEGGVCAYGALYAAAGMDVQSLDWDASAMEDDAEFNAAADALQRKVTELGLRTIIHFNDSETTTQQDVLNLFDKTISGLEEIGS